MGVGQYLSIACYFEMALIPGRSNPSVLSTGIAFTPEGSLRLNVLQSLGCFSRLLYKAPRSFIGNLEFISFVSCRNKCANPISMVKSFRNLARRLNVTWDMSFKAMFILGATAPTSLPSQGGSTGQFPPSAWRNGASCSVYGRGNWLQQPGIAPTGQAAVCLLSSSNCLFTFSVLGACQFFFSGHGIKLCLVSSFCADDYVLFKEPGWHDRLTFQQFLPGFGRHISGSLCSACSWRVTRCAFSLSAVCAVCSGSLKLRKFIFTSGLQAIAGVSPAFYLVLPLHRNLVNVPGTLLT